jgi:DNA-binding PadR family transcriptional regulator
LIQNGRRGRFWQMWSEAQRKPKRDAGSEESVPRTAWQRFFAGFFGVSPENHWLFGGRRFRPWFTGGGTSPGQFNPFVAEVMSKGGGLLSLYVLHLLFEQPRYGNDIMRQIEVRTQGGWGANPGAIYPLLATMEESGLVEGVWQDTLTPAGHQELVRLCDVIRPKLLEAINVLQDLHGDLAE